MSHRTMRQVVCLGAVLAATLAGNACAQPPVPRSKVVTWQSNANETFVGILGEVAKPGVYRLDPSSMSMQSLVRRAGGLTDEASHTIRLVRQDRVVQNLYFSPQLDGPLLPNDLLVVESKRSQAAVSKRIDSDPRLQSLPQATAPSAESAGVQVAFLNVLERPVIVKVKHENARVDHLVQMLDQPIELAQAVRILAPDRLSTPAATTQQVLSTLSDGSVIVFPRNSINREKLPALPPAYESEIASGAFPSLIGGPSGQSPELRNVGQLAPMIARGAIPGIYSNPQTEQAANPIPLPSLPAATATPQQSRIEAPNSSTPVVSSSPRIATIPFTGGARVTSSSNRTAAEGGESANSDNPTRPSNAPSSAGALPESTAGNSKTTASIDSETILKPGDEIDPADGIEGTAEATTSAFSFQQMVGIFFCVGGLIGLALLVRRHLDRSATVATQAGTIEVPGAQPSIPDEEQSWRADAKEQSTPQLQETSEISEVTPAAESLSALPQSGTSKKTNLEFDRLIHNQLPQREEPIEFPTGVVLQGRIAPRPKFRVDQAASQAMGQGPHFAVSAHTASKSEASSEIPIVSDQLDRPHASKPSKPHFLRRRSSEKTVAAAAMSKSMSQQPDTMSQTPVSDALRHLDGGRP